MIKKPLDVFLNKLKNLFSKKKNTAPLLEETEEVAEIPVQNNAFSSSEQDELKKLREQLAQVDVNDEEWEVKTPETKAAAVEKTSPGFVMPTEDLLNDPIKLKEALSKAQAAAEDDFVENNMEPIIPLQEMPINRGAITSFDRTDDEEPIAPKKSSIGGAQGYDFEHFFHHLYSPEFRPKVHRAFILILVGVITYTLGKSIAMWIQPEKKIVTVRHSFTPPNKSNSMDQIQKLTQSNLFNIKQNETDEKKIENVVKKTETPKVCLTADKQSALPYKIVNTSVLQDTVKSIASVQVREGEVVNIREGDTFETMELGRVLRQRIIIKNVQTNECEYIENKDAANDRKFDVLTPTAGKKLIGSKFNTDIKNEGNRFSIKKKLRDEAVSDLNSILTQAKAIPIQNPDGTMSFKMTEITPGSIYSKLNIQDDDIITAIDGEKIKNLNEVMNKFGKIKDIDHIEITVQRNGNEQRLEYSFD